MKINGMSRKRAKELATEINNWIASNGTLFAKASVWEFDKAEILHSDKGYRVVLRESYAHQDLMVWMDFLQFHDKLEDNYNKAVSFYLTPSEIAQ